MSLRVPVGEAAAEALRKVRPNLLKIIEGGIERRRERAGTASIDEISRLGSRAAARLFVEGRLSKRQARALAIWEGLGADDRTPAAVAAELGVNVGGARQLLHLAGVIRTRPGHKRRMAAAQLRQGKSAAEVQAALGLNDVSLEFAIHDYAYELLVEGGGELPSSQSIGYSSSRRRL